MRLIPSLVAKVADMHRPGAAERCQKGSRDVPASLADVHTYRGRHQFVDDVMDDPRGLCRAHGQRSPDRRHDSLLGGRRVEPHCAAGEVVRREIAEDQIRVRHGRLIAPQTIASRSRIGGGTVRAYLDDTQRVDARDATSACADLDHVDGRYGDGETARLGEAARARNFQLVRQRQRASTDQAHLRGGAAHVVGEDLRHPEQLR